MESKPATIAFVLSQLAAEAARADRIAAVAAERMHAIHQALAPIIGERGVSALYRRSLLLAARSTSWEGFAQGPAEAGDDYSALQSAIGQQSDALALDIAQALFSHLYTVLVSLIGAALTQRLLHPMFDPSANGQAVQETPHE